MSCPPRVAACAACVVVLVVGGPRAASAVEAVVLRPPTSAPVLDPFRLPTGPYGAGNRGIEYDTRPGDPIRAAGFGRVVFAGPVAGAHWVTVDHGGGLTSTYGVVARIAVRIGDRVEAGDLVAVAGGPFHFGLRLEGVYVDPALRFARRVVQVRLVPHGPPTRPVPAPAPAAPGAATAHVARATGERATHVIGRVLRAGERGLPATLLDGPNGPRTVPGRRRRITSARATPGRLGVRHGISTGKKEISWQSSP